nr:hypothetical protein CFP56_41516 [Quercus suber]
MWCRYPSFGPSSRPQYGSLNCSMTGNLLRNMLSYKVATIDTTIINLEPISLIIASSTTPCDLDRQWSSRSLSHRVLHCIKLSGAARVHAAIIDNDHTPYTPRQSLVLIFESSRGLSRWSLVASIEFIQTTDGLRVMA